MTRQVTIPVEAEAVGGIVRLAGGFSIKQTEFGMKPYAKFGGVVGVADELKIYGDIRLARQRDCRVTGITLSGEQRRWACWSARLQGVGGRPTRTRRTSGRRSRRCAGTCSARRWEASPTTPAG